ncbi:hypothetical protein B0H13DRAFT_2541218 [Mycena leptocephala]|nr:hypothetical protein B0H13DRAFT_2541218 [Mycena leptocephala]
MAASRRPRPEAGLECGGRVGDVVEQRGARGERGGSRRTAAHLKSAHKKEKDKDEETHLQTSLKVKRARKVGHVIEPAPRRCPRRAARSSASGSSGYPRRLRRRKRPRGGRGHIDVGDSLVQRRRRRRRAGTAPVLVVVVDGEEGALAEEGPAEAEASPFASASQVRALLGCEGLPLLRDRLAHVGLALLLPCAFTAREGESTEDGPEAIEDGAETDAEEAGEEESESARSSQHLQRNRRNVVGALVVVTPFRTALVRAAGCASRFPTEGDAGAEAGQTVRVKAGSGGGCGIPSLWEETDDVGVDAAEPDADKSKRPQVRAERRVGWRGVGTVGGIVSSKTQRIQFPMRTYTEDDVEAALKTPPSPSDGPGKIYGLRVKHPDGTVVLKVGRSIEPDRRTEQWECQCWKDDIELLWAIPTQYATKLANAHWDSERCESCRRRHKEKFWVELLGGWDEAKKEVERMAKRMKDQGE